MAECTFYLIPADDTNDYSSSSNWGGPRWPDFPYQYVSSFSQSPEDKKIFDSVFDYFVPKDKFDDRIKKIRNDDDLEKIYSMCTEQVSKRIGLNVIFNPLRRSADKALR